jgi:Fungal specific transcription factor domain
MPALGCGFPEDWKLSGFKDLQELFTALQYVAAYTVIAYDHCQGTAMHSVGALTDKRNSTQYRMLSVPRYPYEKHSEAPHQLYESTRLAAEIYCLLCVYPCPPTTAPFDRLATLLRRELSHLDQRNISFEESRLLVWIFVMGAIVTVDTSDRLWFISALSHLSSRLQLESWYDMKSILVTFLWLDMTNDMDGRDVWDEVSLSRYKYCAAARFSSSPSVESSRSMTIQTRSTSPPGTEEMLGANQLFSSP